MSINLIKKILELSSKSIQKETLFSSVNPLVKFHNDNNSILVTLNKDFVQVLRLEGMEYSGLDKTKLKSYYDNRRIFFNSIDEKIIFTTFSTREMQKKNHFVTYSNKYEDMISNKWSENFTENFKSYHYVIISSTSNDRFSDLSVFEKLIEDSTKAKYANVTLTSNKVLRELKEFSPTLLKDDELLTFFTTYANGKYTYQKKPKNNYIKDLICSSTLSFPDDKDYMIYENNSKTYSKFVSIMLFNNEKFDSSLLEELMSSKVEFILHQSFKKVPKITAIEIILDKIKNVMSFFVSSETAIKNLYALSEEIEGSTTNLYDYSFTMQIKNDSLTLLDENVNEIQSIINRFGYQSVVETTNIEPLFFSALPGLENYNTRKRNLKTEYIASLNTFSTVSQGYSKCSWGNMPVTQFYNSHNTVFDFTFHKSPLPFESGNTVIIGGIGVGKTALMTFLIEESQKFKNLKTLILDSLQGMRVFTEFMDGNYSDFDSNVSLNPLQLPDNIENREFLKNFFKAMTQTEDKDAESIKIIDAAINSNYENLDKKDRTFFHLLSAFGIEKDENDIVSKMYNWVHGSNRRFFASEKDSLDFSRRISAFNMDTVLSNKEASGLVAIYLFHRFMKVVENSVDGCGLLFIDEIREYLENPFYAQQIAKAVFQFRKKNIAIVMAAQDHKFFQTNTYAKQILGGSLANLILFPDSTVDEDYKTTLNLTSEEFRFIKNPTGKREVLLKRIGGGSTILNVDLAPLGSYLNIFNSSTSAINLMKKCKKEDPINWREEYLKC
jgi:type IV secretion system protein VirB4